MVGLIASGSSSALGAPTCLSFSPGRVVQHTPPLGDGYEFEEGLGIVVCNLVDSTCYYYDVFGPDDPLQTSRAMSCRPGVGDDMVMTLQQWHQQSTRDAASWSWVDVGHRSPGGALTNDLL